MNELNERRAIRLTPREVSSAAEQLTALSNGASGASFLLERSLGELVDLHSVCPSLITGSLLRSFYIVCTKIPNSAVMARELSVTNAGTTKMLCMWVRAHD